MRSLLKSRFLWQFAGGFAIGAAGLLAMQPAEATQTLAAHLHIGTHLVR